MSGLAQLAAASNETQYDYARRKVYAAKAEVRECQRALDKARKEVDRWEEISDRIWKDRKNGNYL